MKRQRRLKKITPVFDRVKDLVVGKAFGALIVFIAISAAVVSGKTFLYRSSYFSLRTVEVKSAFLDQRTALNISNQWLSSYKGKNIFKISLKGMAESLRHSYPEVKEVVVSIALPDRLVISLKFRRPVAFLKNGTSYPIDEEGVALPSLDAASLRDLPVIEGINVRYEERKSRKAASRNLRLAIDLLREIKMERFIAPYGVSKIDAADIASLSFYLKNGVEVKIGYENFKERLHALEKVLKDPRLLLGKVRYIDLRFKDVVIGPKE